VFEIYPAEFTVNTLLAAKPPKDVIPPPVLALSKAACILVF